VNHVDNAGITALVVAAREGCVEARRSGRPPVEWFKGRFHLPVRASPGPLSISREPEPNHAPGSAGSRAHRSPALVAATATSLSRSTSAATCMQPTAAAVSTRRLF
jgi:hypothetical protein